LVPDLNFLGTGGSTASHRSATFEIERMSSKMRITNRKQMIEHGHGKRQERYLPKGPHSFPTNQAAEAGCRQRAEYCIITDLIRTPRLYLAVHVAVA